MSDRTVVFEHTLEPGTGRAVPLLAGQILRVEQVVGGQCADFNAFNLHDYKEHFDAARTRYMSGPAPTVGDSLWSAPPRDRPMLTIVADTGGANDVTYQRCSAFVYEYQGDYADHTNCQDIQAEAQREYGLTPDDVHDPFNLFMYASVDESGRQFVGGNPSQRGSHVDLFAQFDVLAVTNVCGSDTSPVSNFGLRPVRLTVFESEPDERRRWQLPERQFRSQRTPDSFRVTQIKATRELVRDPGYRPEWPVYPITETEIEVELSEEDWELLQDVRAGGRLGDDDGEVLKRAFFSWWIENRRRGLRHFHAAPPARGA
jgi:uncharacterized protein YcgI (DUF1989 family)